jgi:hypothetical protein
MHSIHCASQYISFDKKFDLKFVFFRSISEIIILSSSVTPETKGHIMTHGAQKCSRSMIIKELGRRKIRVCKLLRNPKNAAEKHRKSGRPPYAHLEISNKVTEFIKSNNPARIEIERRISASVASIN